VTWRGKAKTKKGGTRRIAELFIDVDYILIKLHQNLAFWFFFTQQMALIYARRYLPHWNVGTLRCLQIP